MKKLFNVCVNESYKILAQWEAFPDPQDRTWEPLLQLKDEMSGIIRDFLHDPIQRNLKSWNFENFINMMISAETVIEHWNLKI